MYRVVALSCCMFLGCAEGELPGASGGDASAIDHPDGAPVLGNDPDSAPLPQTDAAPPPPDAVPDASPPVCTIDADCDAVSYGAWSACGYASFCSEIGTRQRNVFTPVCVDDDCATVATVEEEACGGRTTEGSTCADDGDYCGTPMSCHVCRSGSCEVNTPHYDAACNPSCGHAGGLCGVTPMCCAAGTTCALGTVGGGSSYADCDVCCVNSC